MNTFGYPDDLMSIFAGSVVKRRKKFYRSKEEGEKHKLLQKKRKIERKNRKRGRKK